MTTPLFFQDVARVANPKLSGVLCDAVERRFGTLAELPSNVEAIDAGLLFASGHQPFVSVVGPSGWGKTHLLECVANHATREFGFRVRVVSALDWIEGRHVFDPRTPLLLDNVQDAMARTRSRVQLRLALERRVRIGRPTMLAITSPRLTRQHVAFLPAYREWSLQEIGEPTAVERRTVVEQMARSGKIQISRSLARLLASRMKGNGNTIHGALNSLRLEGRDWTEPQDVLRACGILDHFFADNSSWDLKERVRQAAERASHQFPILDPAPTACHAMLRIAQLSEIDVARFCGFRPAKARATAIAFSHWLDTCEKGRSAHRHFLEIVVESLGES